MARLVRWWRRDWSIPWPVVVIGCALGLVGWIQGWRLAAERSAFLQPERIEILALDPEGRTTVEASDRLATFDLGAASPPRVALYQILPARPLIRWIEPAGRHARERWIVIPLAGLPAGLYAVCAVDPAATAGPVEMDRPVEELDELGRFRVAP